MTSVNILEIVAILLLLINHSNTLLCKDKANPSLGDLCLEQGSKGIVQVYYADNFNSVGWGTMCDDLVDQSALDTMCKQLGYDTSPASMGEHYNDINPWFTQVMCHNKTTQNILRCGFISPDPIKDLNCSKIYLQCGPDDSWNKVPNKGYIGQVLLVHPKNTAPGHQVSFGLVLIYMQVNGDHSWGVITQDQTKPFTRNAADSVCRQMGYTEADPKNITTVKNSNTRYSLTNVQETAWLTSTNARDCIDSSERCFSCCFTRPTQPCSRDTCKYEDSLVLQCLFDLHKNNSEGTEELCQISISDHRKPNSCTDTPGTTSTPGTTGTPGPPYESITFSLVGVSSVLLLIIVIAILVVLVYCCYRRCCRRHPRGNPEQQRLLPNLDERQN